jgi:hypothetical protein
MSAIKKSLLLAIGAMLVIGRAPAVMDETIDCAGVPYWDRFVVNDKDTGWSADGKCYGGKAEENPQTQRNQASATDYSGLYGYNNGANPAGKAAAAEGASNTGWQNLYGYRHGDNPQNKGLYGYYHGVNPAAEKPAVGAPTAPLPAATASESPKAAAKPAAKKQPAAKKPAPAKPVAVAAAPAPKPAEPKPAPKKEAAAAPVAAAIASTARKPTLEDFCPQRNAPVMGQLPAGLILMRGAPQNMSCVIK